MVYNVFQATAQHSLKNDFVKTCENYMKILEVNLSFLEIEEMSKSSLKKIVKEKTTNAAFQYLIKEKNKQSKISHINYSKLEIQEYLLEGNKNIKIAQLIFKSR